MAESLLYIHYIEAPKVLKKASREANEKNTYSTSDGPERFLVLLFLLLLQLQLSQSTSQMTPLLFLVKNTNKQSCQWLSRQRNRNIHDHVSNNLHPKYLAANTKGSKMTDAAAVDSMSLAT